MGVVRIVVLQVSEKPDGHQLLAKLVQLGLSQTTFKSSLKILLPIELPRQETDTLQARYKRIGNLCFHLLPTDVTVVYPPLWTRL